jgi:hypothetical protein
VRARVDGLHVLVVSERDAFVLRQEHVERVRDRFFGVLAEQARLDLLDGDDRDADDAVFLVHHLRDTHDDVDLQRRA